MPRVPRLALVLSGLALATIAAVLVLGGAPWAERSDSSIGPRPFPPASNGNTVPPDVLAAPWFVQTFDFASEEELRGFRLSIGLLDGTVTRDVSIGLADLNPPIQWSGALPFATGPDAGRVLYGYFDGTVSRLRVVSVAAGDDQLLLETDKVVHQAVLDPLTDVFYYLALDPATRREVGIFRGTVLGGATEQLVPARASPRATQIVSRLFLTPDGSRLVSYDCRDDDCRLRAYITATGDRVFDVAAPASDPYGITDSEIVLSGASASVGAECRQAPCPAIAFDLDSGQQRQLVEVCSAATVVEAADRPILISDAERAPCGLEPNPIIATDLRNGGLVVEFPLQDSRELVIDTRDQAVGLPDGWFLLGNAGQFYTLDPAAQQDALTLVRVDGALTFDIPAVSVEHR